MHCLTDSAVQAVVDTEADDATQAHVAGCPRCRARVEERRRDMAALAVVMTAEGDVSPALEARMRQAIATGQAVRGATTLRDAPAGSWRRAGWLSAAATAAALALIVFLVLPKLGAPTSLSASEILGRSLETLSSTTGVETLDYELFIAGAMPGPHRIEHVIDHDRPGRFRFSDYRPDGTVEAAISQDPATGRRLHLIRVDDKAYVVDLKVGKGAPLSLPEMGQALVETAISMMQATSDQNLTTLDTPEGRQYVVEMPRVTPASGVAMLDLYHARALIDERDFRIREFEASGTLLKQPYSVSFRLLRRSVRPSAEVAPEEFRLPTNPGDIVLSGETAQDPLSDVLAVALREIGRLRGR